MRSKINLILLLLLLIVITGIVFVLRNLSATLIYQEITSLVITILIWGLFITVIHRLFIRFLYLPILKIKEVLRLLSNGDLSAKITLKGNDDLTEIAD